MKIVRLYNAANAYYYLTSGIKLDTPYKPRFQVDWKIWKRADPSIPISDEVKQKVYLYVFCSKENQTKMKIIFCLNTLYSNRYVAELEAENLDYTDKGVGILRFSQVFCAIHALAGPKFKCI